MYGQRERHSKLLYQNEIVFSVGGVKDGKALKSCEGFVLAKKDWKRYSDMTVARVSPGLCVLGSYLYAFGGTSAQQGNLVTVERLSTEFDMWSYVKMTLPVPLHGISVHQVKQDFLIVFGGFGSGSGERTLSTSKVN